MRTGLTYFQMPSSTSGVSGGRYTLEQLAQNTTYAQVVRRIDNLEGTYAEGARMYLPPAIEAAETMLTPEQTAKLCNDTFSHIESTAFQAFERYPDIFRAARGRLKPKHILNILEKLAIRTRKTLPFHGLAKTIEGMEGLSSKGIVDLISTGIHADGFLTCRTVDRLAPAYNSARPRFTSDDEAIGFFRLAKKRFGKRADMLIRMLPLILDGIEGKIAPETILGLDAFTKKKIPELSPAGNAIVSLYKIVLFKQGNLNPDLAVEALIETIRKEGDKARRSDLPTVGGKIGGKDSNFEGRLFPYLTMLGFDCRSEILHTSWTAKESTTQMIKLPAARSAFETSLLVDMLREVGVFRDGSVLRHQITVEGRLVEEAKYIALALHSTQPILVPYPQTLTGHMAGITHLAPVVEGGWMLANINNKWLHGKWRFDFALLNLYVLMDERQVLLNALARNEHEWSHLEQMLVGLYEMFKERVLDLPKQETRDVIPDETLEVLVTHKTERKSSFVVGKLDMPEKFFEALEGAYGEDLVNVRANHEFNIYATQILTWAMKSPWRSEPRNVYKRFMASMHDLYRRAGVESTLTTTWKKRQWEQIYPSLSQLDAIKDREFHRAVRDLVIKTVQKLQKMV